MNGQRDNVAQLRPAAPGVTCLRFKAINKGALVGLCDFHIGAWKMTIFDCKHFRKTPETLGSYDAREWIGLPSSSFTNKDGKVIYKTLVEFVDKDAAERFQKAALAALSAFLRGASA